MTAFSPANVAKAEARIPQTDSKTLRVWVQRGREQGLAAFVSACERELALRGPLELDASQAERHAIWAENTRDVTLQTAIEFAFEQRGPSDDEKKLTRLIAAHPGISYAELVASYGKRDVSLVLGHFVYERYGCFKPWIVDAKRMSDILFERDETGPSVRYRLTAEAEAAFEHLGFSLDAGSSSHDPAGQIRFVMAGRVGQRGWSLKGCGGFPRS